MAADEKSASSHQIVIASSDGKDGDPTVCTRHEHDEVVSKFVSFSNTVSPGDVQRLFDIAAKTGVDGSATIAAAKGVRFSSEFAQAYGPQIVDGGLALSLLLVQSKFEGDSKLSLDLVAIKSVYASGCWSRCWDCCCPLNRRQALDQMTRSVTKILQDTKNPAARLLPTGR